MHHCSRCGAGWSTDRARRSDGLSAAKAVVPRQRRGASRGSTYPAYREIFRKYKICLDIYATQKYLAMHPVPAEGRFAIVTARWARGPIDPQQTCGAFGTRLSTAKNGSPSRFKPRRLSLATPYPGRGGERAVEKCLLETDLSPSITINVKIRISFCEILLKVEEKASTRYVRCSYE
jgi:hypothetical protein